jgi:hypothetical protein
MSQMLKEILKPDVLHSFTSIGGVKYLKETHREQLLLTEGHVLDHREELYFLNLGIYFEIENNTQNR